MCPGPAHKQTNRTNNWTVTTCEDDGFCLTQIYDAGEVFGIMQFRQDVDEEKKDDLGTLIHSKVVVTRDSGLQTSEETR